MTNAIYRWSLNLVTLGCLAAILFVVTGHQLFSSRLLNGVTGAQWDSLKTVFVSIFLEALPFILLGVVISSALNLYVSEERLQKLIPRNPLLGVVYACLLGILLPVCECGMIPIVRRLIGKGMPVYIGVTYILAAPILNPVTFAATYMAFRTSPQMVVYRMGLAFAVACVIGLALYHWSRTNPLKRHIDGSDVAASAQGNSQSHEYALSHGQLRVHDDSHEHGRSQGSAPSLGQSYGHAPVEAGQARAGYFVQPEYRNNYIDADPGRHRSSASSRRPVHAQSRHAHSRSHAHDYRHSHDHHHSHRGAGRLAAVLTHASDEFFEMGKFLMIGAFLTALIQTFVSRQELVHLSGGGGIGANVLMMGFAYLISLCSTSDAFVAASFNGVFPNGALLSFLVFGPMVDFKNTLMMLAVFRSGFVLKLIAMITVVVLVGSIVAGQLGANG